MATKNRREEEAPMLAPGDIVRHISNADERYKIISVLENSAWATRQSDGLETMLLVENLRRCA